MLLQYGCNLNGRDDDSSPLWIAVENRHLDFARFLLSAKAEANTGDHQSAAFPVRRQQGCGHGQAALGQRSKR
jgi:ankyrin repeat protein